MNLKELQNQASTVFLNNLKRDNIQPDKTYLLLKLTEEVGEFIQSYLIHTKACRPEKYREPETSHQEVSKELADVLGLVFVIAKEMNVNLEDALVKKWITREWLKPNK